MLDFNKNQDRIPPLRGGRGGLCVCTSNTNTPLTPLKGGIRSRFLLKSSMLTEGARFSKTKYQSPNKFLKEHLNEFTSVVNLDLDSSFDFLANLYSTVKRASYRDPICMLRSLLLMFLFRISSISKWVKQLRTIPILAVLSGLDFQDTPGPAQRTWVDFKNLTNCFIAQRFTLKQLGRCPKFYRLCVALHMPRFS